MKMLLSTIIVLSEKKMYLFIHVPFYLEKENWSYTLFNTLLDLYIQVEAML